MQKVGPGYLREFLTDQRDFKTLKIFEIFCDGNDFEQLHINNN